MNTRYLLLLLIPALWLSSCTTETKEVAVKQQRMILEQARKNGDNVIVRNSLYELLALDGNQGPYLDSLLQFYFQSGMYSQALLMARGFDETRQEDTTILEILAVSEEMVGLYKDALEHYEALYTKSKKVDHLYQLASIQYRLKRYQECNTSLSELYNNPEIEGETVVINYGQNRQQEVPMKAAILNLNGVLNLDLKNYAEAEQAFTQALKVFPDFELANGNLQAVDQLKQSATTESEG